MSVMGNRTYLDPSSVSGKRSANVQHAAQAACLSDGSFNRKLAGSQPVLRGQSFAISTEGIKLLPLVCPSQRSALP